MKSVTIYYSIKYSSSRVLLDTTVYSTLHEGRLLDTTVYSTLHEECCYVL